jgi:hypothetical protein
MEAIAIIYTLIQAFTFNVVLPLYAIFSMFS